MCKFSSTVNVVGVCKPHCPLTFPFERPAQGQLKVQSFFRRRIVNTGVRITGSRFARYPSSRFPEWEVAAGFPPFIPLLLSQGTRSPQRSSLCLSVSPNCLYNPQPAVNQDAIPKLGFSQPILYSSVRSLSVSLFLTSEILLAAPAALCTFCLGLFELGLPRKKALSRGGPGSSPYFRALAFPIRSPPRPAQGPCRRLPRPQLPGCSPGALLPASTQGDLLVPTSPAKRERVSRQGAWSSGASRAGPLLGGGGRGTRPQGIPGRAQL